MTGKKIINTSGFTLLEILIAMVIFSIGLLGVAKMQISSIRSNSYSQEMTDATILAKDKIEELMAIDYNNRVLLNDVDTDGSNGGGLDDTGANADYSQVTGRYTLSWNVAIDFPIQNTMTLRFIVTWQDGGQTKNVTMDYMKFDQI
ncbi:MAG: prepilin-type N-terminal cleavage/methylation domain-containing protein [Desulfobacteraceae bacterium]|nr:prepilin-type N-terminal cleavage/methylation domain-containing protein [Desulfobacteraceae bacterium]